MLFDPLRPRDAHDPSSIPPNKTRLWKTFPPSPLPVTLFFSGVYKTAEPPLASTHSYKFKPHLFTSLLVACSLQSSLRFSMLRSATPRFCSGIWLRSIK